MPRAEALAVEAASPAVALAAEAAEAGSLKKFHNSYFIIISMPWAIPSSAFDFVIYFA